MARDRTPRAVRQRQDHQEVVLAHELSFQLRSVSHRYGHGIAYSAAASPPAKRVRSRRASDPGILQRPRAGVLPRKSLQIANRGMAAGAGPVEVALPGFRIADQDIELQSDGIPSRRTPLPTGSRQDTVDVLCDRDRVSLVQDDLRVMLRNCLTDQFAV